MTNRKDAEARAREVLAPHRFVIGGEAYVRAEKCADLMDEVQREAIERAAKVVEDFFSPNASAEQLYAEQIAAAIRSIGDPDHADVDGSRGNSADDITYAGLANKETT